MNKYILFQIIMIFIIPITTLNIKSSESDTVMTKQELLDKHLIELVIKMQDLLKQGANPATFAGLLTQEEKALLSLQPKIQNQENEEKRAFFDFIFDQKTWSQHLFQKINENFQILNLYNQNEIMQIITHLVIIPMPSFNNIYHGEDLRTSLIYDITKKNGLLHKILSLQQIKNLSDSDFDKFLINLFQSIKNRSFIDPELHPGAISTLILLNNMRPKKTLYPIDAKFANKTCPWTSHIRHDWVAKLMENIIKNKEFDINEILNDLIIRYIFEKTSRNTNSPEFFQRLLNLITFAILHGGSLNPEVIIEDPNLKKIIQEAQAVQALKKRHKMPHEITEEILSFV